MAATLPLDYKRPGSVDTTTRFADVLAALGGFHVLLLHFPIGFVAAAACLEVALLARPRAGLRTAIGVLLALAAASPVAAAACGWLLAEDGGYDETLLARHRWLGVTTAALAVVVVWLHRWVSTRASRRAYRLALAACVVVTAGAAHFGGMLTHGSTTPFGRLASALRGNGDASTAVAAEAVMGATFVTTVAPILETHCQECHGPEKQKHGLRLDSREAALKGGESGKPAIVPGDAMASVLVEAITLPPTNERAMPPEGKPRLSPEQVVTLIDWINRGAEWADATQRASIGVEPPPPHALAELRKAGFQVAPLARGISLVRVDVVPPDARLAALRPIAEQIAWLDLSGKVLEPGESAELAAMPNLTRLELQRSNVGDDDLRQVASLPRPPSTACSRHRTSASAWPATGSTWSATPTPTGTTRTSTATSTRTATGSSTRSTRTCRSIASPSSSSRAISCRRRQSRSVWPPATTG